MLKNFLKRKVDLRGNFRCVIRTRSPHIRHFLSFRDIHFQILIPCVLSYNLTFINLLAWVNEITSPILQSVKRISKCLTCFGRDDGTTLTCRDIIFINIIPTQTVIDNSFSGSYRKNTIPQANKPSGWDIKLKML